MSTYEEIMGIAMDIEGSNNSTAASVVATKALSRRLQLFRTWLQDEAHAEIHPAICIVNGEATDGTKNAPVLLLEKRSNHNPSESLLSVVGIGEGNGKVSTSLNGASSLENAITSTRNGKSIDNAGTSTTSYQNTSSVPIIKKVSSIFEGRVGMIDHYDSQNGGTALLYDKTMGCQIRTVREMKPNDTMMILPRTSMITPDLVAASDAGKALFSCCKPQTLSSTSSNSSRSAWDVLENTTICESQYLNKIVRHSGTQTLVKILQERKRAENAYKQRMDDIESASSNIQLAEYGAISTRAPFLLFLIHQRFYNSVHVPVCNVNYTDSYDGSSDDSWTAVISQIQIPPGAPQTFAPYARTLPSSVSIPLCWKRNELAMLSSCIPGIPLLHDVAANTMLLTSEFIALINAGLLERFPNTFPPGLITWDRYVWAAAVFASRNLPATSYYNQGDTSGASFQPTNPLEFQSPPEIWDEVGVLIPLLDMLNHEVEDHQVTWEQSSLSKSNSDLADQTETMNGNGNGNNKLVTTHPKAMIHKKVKKGAEIYCCYGSSLSNTNLILQYGFAQINNISDEVRLGWSITDAVGNVDPPIDYIPPPYPTTPRKYNIYESNDDSFINSWWTPDRMALLEVEACCSDSTLLSNLKLKKKMSVMAYADGRFNPILLSAVVVATMPEKELLDFVTLHATDEDKPKSRIVISKRHQSYIQCYLQFTFIRKLEKLLQNLNNGLNDFFPNLKLWTKFNSGGLQYQPSFEDDNHDNTGNTNNNSCMGWQTFFDLHAYKAAIEVDSRYYAMGTESCVLTMYDGQLRALQASLDAVTDSMKYETIVVKQLHELGYVMSLDDTEDDDNDDDGDDDDDDADIDVVTDTDVVTTDQINNAEANNNTSLSTNNKKSPRNRKRNRRKNNSSNNKNHTVVNSNPNYGRVPALKLHVGNLSYTTTPAHLYDFFSSIYGQDKVLECHIPVERDTGKSRGFGFVVMPEVIAEGVLKSGRKFEMNGRTLKVARSSSTGVITVSTKVPDGPPPNSNNERCVTCGYRPKYCVCPHPHVGGMHRPPIPHDISTLHRRNDPMINREFGPNEYYRDDRYQNREYRDERGRYHDFDRDRRYGHQYYDADPEYRRRYDRERDDDYYRGHGHHSHEPRDYHDRDHSPPNGRNESSHRRWDNEDTQKRPSRDESSHRRWENNEDTQKRPSRDRGNDDDSVEIDHDRKRSRSKEKNSRRKKNKKRHRSRSSDSSASPTKT